jgi:hypothetical protein
MNPFPLAPGRLVVVLRAVATLGVAASLLGVLAGWLLIGRTASALQASLELTDETLTALDASAGVADDAIAALGVSLGALEATASDLDGAFDDGQALMTELAVLVRDDVAGSVAAVEGALPGLITAGATIDATLGALSSLPFGPDYDPEQSFGQSLEGVQASLEGLPARLQVQADLIEATGASLADVGDGVAELSAEVAGFETTLGATAELLATYDATIAEGRSVVAEARDDLGSQLWLARMAVVLAAVAFAAMQVVPLQMAAMVDRRVDGGAQRTADRSAERPAERSA